jgi:hypothetical protein
MYFIFGYCREVPIKIKTETSKTTLVGLAILIISLLIFLSFENLAKDTSIPPTIFEPPPSLDNPIEPTQVEGIKFEKDRIYSEKGTGFVLKD